MKEPLKNYSLILRWWWRTLLIHLRSTRIQSFNDTLALTEASAFTIIIYLGFFFYCIISICSIFCNKSAFRFKDVTVASVLLTIFPYQLGKWQTPSQCVKQCASLRDFHLLSIAISKLLQPITSDCSCVSNFLVGEFPVYVLTASH